MMAGSRTFAPGLALEPHKLAALAQPIGTAPAPALAAVALDQGDGREAIPRVRAGERVRMGQLIALAEDQRGTDVHAPVAGRVRAVVPLVGLPGQAIILDNDGSDEPDPACVPCPDHDSLEPSELLARLRKAGIAGLGGAAYPTAAKLAFGRDRAIGHLVLNGAECEPWICCDDALMRERAGDVVLGAQVMLRACGASHCSIAIEDDKPEAAVAMREAVAASGDPRLSVIVLPALYPAGAERQLLTAITGLEVPSGRWPPDAGLLCQNVGTAAAVAHYWRTGEPLIRRVVTVNGSGVARPGNLDVRIGTPLAGLIAFAGGYAGSPVRLWQGGGMTGRALPDDSLPVTRATNCVVAATHVDLRPPAGPEMACIRCGDCASVCPAGLLPQQLHRAVRSGDEAALARFGLADCIECGCCDYVCPSAIPLTERFRRARAEMRERKEATRRANEARLHFEQRQQRLADLEELRRREFEEARRRAREPAPGGDRQ